MEETLKPEFPSQGWRQILTARKEILDAYDTARQQSKLHEVETFHGNVFEATFRKWLRTFLPRRYGVTPGYVVSTGLKSAAKAPHFDVIIYDRIEAPILWIEGNPDASRESRSRAIPVEYVGAVLEAKSSLSAATVKDSLTHLNDLSPLLNGMDASDQRYKIYLPPRFFCGLVCAELRESEMHSQSILDNFVEFGLAIPRGLFGGVVLRAGSENTLPCTGRIVLTRSETPSSPTPEQKKTSLKEFGISESIRISDKVYISSWLIWSESEFAKLAFDIVAMLNGTYEVGRLSSFYGIGSSFVEMMKDAGVEGH